MNRALLARDGSIIPVEVTCNYLKYHDDEYMMAFARDIKKRKQTEEKVSHLASFPSLNPAPIVETDLDGNPSYMNPSARTIFHDLNEKGPAHPVLAGLKAVANELELEKKSYLVREVTIDSSYFLETIHSVPDKKALRIYVLDITDRKRAEEALKESEERFRATFEQSAVGMTHVSLDGRFLRVNKKYCDITGYAENELLGLTVVNITYPPDVEVERERIKKLLAGEFDTFSSEKRYMKKDGSLVWVKLTVALVRDKGKPCYMTGVTEDITEHKRAEEELKAVKEQAELYLDLMGHDINNMNQSAMGYLEMALETLEADGKIGPDGKLFIEKPLQAIINSTKLIENVRKLQRLRTDGIRTRPIDLHDLFEDLRSRDFHVDDKDVTVNFEMIPHFYVEGSELLKDVFYNLISNAVKHSGPDQSVTVDVRVERVGEDGPGILQVRYRG